MESKTKRPRLIARGKNKAYTTMEIVAIFPKIEVL